MATEAERERMREHNRAIVAGRDRQAARELERRIAPKVCRCERPMLLSTYLAGTCSACGRRVA